MATLEVLSHELVFERMERELLGVTLEQLVGGGRLGACFDAVVGEAAGKLSHRFSP